jgi:hypothetical protein
LSATDKQPTGTEAAMARPMSIHDLGFQKRGANQESSLSTVARIAFATGLRVQRPSRSRRENR